MLAREGDGCREGDGNGNVVRGVWVMADFSLYTVYASNPGRQAAKD